MFNLENRRTIPSKDDYFIKKYYPIEGFNKYKKTRRIEDNPFFCDPVGGIDKNFILKNERMREALQKFANSALDNNADAEVVMKFYSGDCNFFTGFKITLI